MVNKKGFLRIVEASIAIVIIMGVLFTYTIRETSAQDPDWSQDAREILEEASRSPEIRKNILSSRGEVPENLELLVEYRLPDFLNYEIRICEVGDVCGMDYVEGNVYAGERVFSTSIDSEEFHPKKVRIFIWE